MLSLEYIAGLIDCDGSIFITYRKREKSWFFGVNFRQLDTAREVVEELRETLQAGKVYNHSGHTTYKMLTWQTTNIKETWNVLITLLPYLRIKREAAQDMLLAISVWSNYKASTFSRETADANILTIRARMNKGNQTQTTRGHNHQTLDNGVLTPTYPVYREICPEGCDTEADMNAGAISEIC